MKVIRKGRDQKGWAQEFICTGRGNGKGGCGAILLVEEDDMYITTRYCGIDDSTDHYNTFKCCDCGVETDLPNAEVPSRVRNKMTTKRRARQERNKMKAIDEYQIGDTVILNMTGMTTRFVGKCISTKKKPVEKTPEHDHPRFEIIGMFEGGERVSVPDTYQGTILKPGDYIIMENIRE